MRLEGPRARSLLSLTPIIDVVFLLLLFFMLASTFSRYADVEIAIGGRLAPSAAEEPVPVVLLSVRGGGVFAVNGAAIDVRSIGAALQSAAPDGKARIVVRPSAASRAEDIVRAIERAQASGLGPVILAR